MKTRLIRGGGPPTLALPIFRRWCRSGIVFISALTALALYCPRVEAQNAAQAVPINRLDARQAAASLTISGGGVVISGTVRNAGAGYTTPPSVIIQAPASGTQATATATVAGGRVTSIVISDGGGGYTEAPVITIAPPSDLQPTGALPVVTPQFAAMGQVAGSSSVLQRGSAPAAPPQSASVRLVSSSFGSTFSSGVPRYFMGDEITPPLMDAASNPFTSTETDPDAYQADLLRQARAYWRGEPIRPGETFSQALDSSPLTPAGSVFIAANTPETFYYSKHAEKVFANQPGGVRIAWVSRLTFSNRYGVKEENFVVSPATRRPVKTIFWTERSFDGPRVPIRDSRITTVNPAYYSLVPDQVAAEVKLPGVPQVVNTDPGVIRKTLWFERYGQEGSLRAYNVEGLVLIEYLGNVRRGDAYEFLGSDVVKIVRQAPVNYVTVNLGEEIRPHDGDASLIAAPNILQGEPKAYYGTTVLPTGIQIFHAERETSPPRVPDNGTPASTEAYSKVVFYWMEEGDFASRWPKFQDRYWQRWPADVQEFAHNTVPSAGSTADTAVQFSTSILPTLVFQDDTNEAEARLDLNTQRMLVSFSQPDGLNRSLLKFTANGKVWYVRVYTQSAERVGYQEGNGDPSQFNATATVGTRIEPPADFTPPSGGATVHYELAGRISRGTCYQPEAYIDPIRSGVEAAAAGAIIPVNARAADRLLEVWWFRKIAAPSSDFESFYMPAKVGRYTVSFPAPPTPSNPTPQIVIAQGIGTGDLEADVAGGSVYYQNDVTKIGYNPNEEHALMIGSRAYALRDDLNMRTPPESEPFVLLSYINGLDHRPDMKAYRVVREVDDDGDRADTEDILFDRPATAGTLLVAPYPLPLMPLPLDTFGRCVNVEVTPPSNQDLRTNGPIAWDSFTKQDRKGLQWVYRGPHDGQSKTKQLAMRYQYASREGFFIPGLSLAAQPAVGTNMPFLRPLSAPNTPDGDAVTGTPLTIIFKPQWPTNAPELRVGETLTLPKFGLPQIRGQKSVEVFYEQSKATTTNLKSVTLHDPTREKTVQLAAQGLDAGLPASIATTTSRGKTYFQRLAPDLQERIYLDPLRAPNPALRPGTLVLLGQFHDEVAGEDYLDLNKLTAKQIIDLKGLCDGSDKDKVKWDASIEALTTKVETFVENPARRGTYHVGASATVGEDELAIITDDDTAVDSYALTATGEAAGWVSLLLGNGEAFTPTSDPVQVKVFRVVPTLYSGELKTIYSKNPLDEKVVLRHTGDFAGKPEDYEFEWRWATGAATAPATYATSWSQRLGGVNNQWFTATNYGSTLPTRTQAAAMTRQVLPRTTAIRRLGYDAAKSSGLLLVPVDAAGIDFTTSGVPGEIAFSATLGELDGFNLYVNGVSALSYNITGSTSAAPVPGLVAGNTLPLQFRVPRNYFSATANHLVLALYSTADQDATSFLDFRLDVSQEVDVVDRNFQSVNDPLPNQKNTNVATISADPTLPFGGSTFVLNDRWFTMRYRPKVGNVAGTGWSRWMAPQLVEGWIKRVLREINPFEQRVKDLYTNAISTDTSVLTQAGSRWEGDIALTLDNIESVGLIAIYETVLNRARSMSIDANTNDPDTNNALMLAAGYLSDLYTLLGNEAFADAANPTISTDDLGDSTEINTSRFSFENQVPNSLQEELALLRGRDASGTRVDISPAYNRLYWNYTGGINAGEVIYATNYNIKEKSGSSTANGVIDAADAQRMFPQGHGDAYGHYLTALKGYYRLLTNKNFSWQRRAEAVLVLGQAVTVDFVDERKLAGDASALAKTAKQICDLTFREQYKEGDNIGWEHFRDFTVKPNTTEKRNWGLDEWVSRSAQGAYYNWVVANALLPDVDNYHQGVEKIDRTTVPELNELAASLDGFQATIDNANAHQNPLGLSPGAIPFDLDPTFLAVGSTAAIGTRPVQGLGHFGQIYERALRTLNNAGGAFDQAARMARLLRNQENQVDDYNTAIVDQERAFRNELIEIFGRPYEGDVGAGKTFAQGYYGPDLYSWFVIDRPNDLIDTTVEDTIQLRIRTGSEVPSYGLNASPANILVDYIGGNVVTKTREVTVTAFPNPYVQYSDLWRNDLGSRPETGELQEALLEAHRAFLELKDAHWNAQVLRHRMSREGALLIEAISSHAAHLSAQKDREIAITTIMSVQKSMETVAKAAEFGGEVIQMYDAAAKEMPPHVVGFAVDVTSPLRSAIGLISASGFLGAKLTQGVMEAASGILEVPIASQEMQLERKLDALGFSLEEKQQAYEFENLFREVTEQEYVLIHPQTAYQAANDRVKSVLARGLRVLEEREIFRQRAAAVVQGYRTKDVSFRIFRNEALEQYRSLFDLSSRYVYQTAKAFDFETGLLGTTEGRATIASIVASRSLGDLRDGNPYTTVSTLGDPGLAGMMARLLAEYTVTEGRLSINNPEINATVFSLRGELFRILDDPNQSADDEAWRQTLEQHFKANILADNDVLTLCRNVAKPDGSPVPGIIIPFSSTIQHGYNFFGLPLAAGDHNFTPSNFSTKINTVGISLPGYVGLDEYATPDPVAGTPALADPLALSATPYVYLIPTGTDFMRVPLGDTNTIREWSVVDQTLPLPFNLGASAFNTTQFFSGNGTLSSQPWILRKHQAFRVTSDMSLYAGEAPFEFSSRRLVGRSAWNSQWKIVIPAYTLLNNEQEGLNRFAATVRDVRLYLRTYSYSGN